MKQILYILAILCILTQSHAQTSTQNYIRTRTYLYQTDAEYRDQVTYFDGVGRPVQTVQAAVTPAKKDLTALQEYDAAGRPSTGWLPAVMTTASGSYTAPATVKTRAQSSHQGDLYPYSTISYETSPLQRATSQMGPGAAWHTGRKALQTGYLTNKAKSGTAIVFADSLVCKLYTTTHSPASVSISCSANYAAGQLAVTRTTDEEGNKAYEFRNKQGQVLLIRQLNGSELIDTYYLYDSFGNLRAVLPPLATTALASGTWTETNATLQQYAYLYKYDDRNRLIAKKLPGA
ncbi:MAG: DUF6443 domain-containing protein, partial [Tannerellaceae bacterium]|nr:DUF6443 domain-containing protein [Tannerellaceae bacterium]